MGFLGTINFSYKVCNYVLDSGFLLFLSRLTASAFYVFEVNCSHKGVRTVLGVVIRQSFEFNGWSLCNFALKTFNYFSEIIFLSVL